MEIQELRIGNLILVYDSIVKVVTGINNGIVYCKTVQEAPCEVDEILIEYCQPIPLKEGWFSSFKWKSSYVIVHASSYRHANKILTFMEFDKEFKNPILYVHQLQNIYYELERKELEIKESQPKFSGK